MLRKTLCVGVIMAGVAWAAKDSLPSGPNPGDKLAEFKVLGFSGDDAGMEFEVLKQVKQGPVLIIFVSKITRPALKFLRPVDDFVAKQDKLAAHVVWLTGDKGDKDETVKFLERAKESLNMKTPMSVFDGKDGPGAYGLNDQVALTVLVAKDQKVTANFALVDPNENDAPKVIRAVAKVLGKEASKGQEKSR